MLSPIHRMLIHTFFAVGNCTGVSRTTEMEMSGLAPGSDFDSDSDSVFDEEGDVRKLLHLDYFMRMRRPSRALLNSKRLSVLVR